VSKRSSISSVVYQPSATSRTHLEDGSTLKRDQHEPSEQTEFPKLVQTPKRNTEQLEDEERRDSVFGEEFGEFGNRDVAEVGSEFRSEVGD